jgi:hypothetical protein
LIQFSVQAVPETVDPDAPAVDPEPESPLVEAPLDVPLVEFSPVDVVWPPSEPLHFSDFPFPFSHPLGVVLEFCVVVGVVVPSGETTGPAVADSSADGGVVGAETSAQESAR